MVFNYYMHMYVYIYIFIYIRINLYELEREPYKKLLQENITKHLKVADEDAYDNINTEA